MLWLMLQHAPVKAQELPTSATQPAALPAAVPDHNDLTQTIIAPIHYEVVSTAGHKWKIDIASDGALTVERWNDIDKPPVKRTGRLSNVQLQELADAFAGWSDLDEEYGEPGADPRQLTLVYGNKKVVAKSLPAGPDALTRARRAVTRVAARSVSPEVPDATAEDLKVTLSEHKGVEGLSATVINISSHPVRIYTPGLVRYATGHFPVSPVQPEFGPWDFVILRPGEAFSRGNKAPSQHGSAGYTIYKPGFEGEQDAIVKVLTSINK